MDYCFRPHPHPVPLSHAATADVASGVEQTENTGRGGHREGKKVHCRAILEVIG